MTAGGERLTRRALLGGALGVAAAGSMAGCTTSRPNAGPAAASAPTPTPRSPSSTPSSAPRPTASAPTPRVNRPGPDITHGPRSTPAVALTFHGAGDPILVTRLLADAKAARARVTVLAIGQWLAATPDLARQIRDAGHELGNHTWSHQTMPRLGAHQTATEIDRAATELDRLTGGIGSWFRPSGTPHSTATIRAAAVRAGYGACLGYDLDPLDYTDPGSAAIVRRVRAGVRPGSIVSLHLGHPGTMAALPGILRVLDQQGLRAVTVSDLLGLA